MSFSPGWLLLLVLPACICPQRTITGPALDGHIVDERGAPHPEARAEVCQLEGNQCTKLDVSAAGTFHADEKADTSWACLCLPSSAHTVSDYVVRVTAEGMLPAEVVASVAQQVVLHPRSIDVDQARRSLVVLYRSANGFSVVLTAAWLQEATREGFSLRVPTPGTVLDEALTEVERSVAVERSEPMLCRTAVKAVLAGSADPFLVRYQDTWLLFRSSGAHSPLRRLLALLQPNATEAKDDAPAAVALSRSDAERVSEEICGAAVGAPGGVALR